MVLGLFVPGNSVIHKINPISKMIVLIFFFIVLFTITKSISFVLTGLFLILTIYLSGIPFSSLLKSIKPILYITIFTFLANLLLGSGKVILSFWILKITDNGIYQASIIAIRLIFITFFTAVISYTTSPLLLATSLEKLLKPLQKFGFPTHEIGMISTIALRFVPTLMDETDKIIKAQKARGGQIESKNLVKRLRALMSLFTPLFVSIFKRADELALAMECRGYRGHEGRTQFRKIEFKKIDIAFIIATSIFMAFICLYSLI